MSEIRSYRDLQVWQRSMDLAVEIYRITTGFPAAEMYGLTNQLRRSAVSVPSSIAEGHMRTPAEYGRLLRIARGSLAEMETQLELAHRVGYLSLADHIDLADRLTSVGKQLTVLANKIDENRGASAQR